MEAEIMDDDPNETYMEAAVLLESNDDADLKRAANIFRRACEKGHIPSKRMLGLMYLEGKGVDRDLKEAYDLISDAAFQDPVAMYALGKMYEGGLGVEQNDREALNLFATVAELGFSDAKEDAERLMSRINDRRTRKLNSRPILNLEISVVDVEAVCCRPMYDSVLDGSIEVVEMYGRGPALVGVDEDGMDVIYEKCPFCSKKVKIVSSSKIY
jgi:hypothetical protein